MNIGFQVARFTAAAAGAVLALSAVSAYAQSNGQLVIAGPGGTFQKALEAGVFPRFKEQYGVEVIYSAGRAANLLAQIEAQSEAPQVDVMLGTDSTHYAAITTRVVEKLDPEKMSHWDDVYDFAKSPEGYGVLYGFQALVVEYNTEVFEENGWEAPTSWYDLWDEKYAGHAVLSSVPSGYAMTFLALLAELEGGTSENLEAIWPRITELAPRVLSFPSSAGQLDQIFGTGGAWIAPNGSGRVAALAATGVPVGMVHPEEGAALNPNWMDVIKNAPNREMAEAFVDFMLSEQSQYEVATLMKLGPVNKNVELTEEEAADVPYGAEVDKLIVVDIGPIEENISAITERFNRIIAR